MSSMNSRERATVGGFLICLAAAMGMLDAAPASAQQGVPPDFSSNQAGWLPLGNDFMQVPGGPSLVKNDPARPYIPNSPGVQSTYRIADLSNPNLKPWAKEQMKKANDDVLAGKIAFTPRSSCMPSGVPVFLAYSRFEPIYFLQTPNEVVMIFSGDQQVRHVYLNVPHSENPKPSWYGESVGHYEGDTLVIDTIAQTTKTFVDNYRTPHSEKLRVVERWKMIDDGKAMEVNFRVEDPDTFNEPWSAMQRFRRVQEPMTEQVCAENNQNLFDYHTPMATNPDF